MNRYRCVRVLFAFAVLAAAACNRFGHSTSAKEHHGGDYGIFLYSSKDAAAYESTKTAFEAWILANHLRPCDPPVPLPKNPWPDPASKEQWYALPDTHHLPYFRVITNDAKHQICATSIFDADLTSGDWAIQRGREMKWWLSVADWFDANATGNSFTSGTNGSKWIREMEDAIETNFR